MDILYKKLNNQNIHTTPPAYHMAGNFDGNLFWRIDEIVAFGGIDLGSWASDDICCNDIHSKMAKP